MQSVTRHFHNQSAQFSSSPCGSNFVHLAVPVRPLNDSLALGALLSGAPEGLWTQEGMCTCWFVVASTQSRLPEPLLLSLEAKWLVPKLLRLELSPSAPGRRYA